MSQLTLKQLASFAADQIQAGKSPAKISGQLAATLVDQRQTKELANLMRLVEAEMARRGTTEVTLVSAYPVSPSVKKQLAKTLRVQNPVFHETIDPSVIGGVRASTEQAELDLTIANQLKSLITKTKGTN